MKELSVIVPVYNEAATIGKVVEAVRNVPLEKEIIVVDDGSLDSTSRILDAIRDDSVKVIHHGSNRGKGVAFLTALVRAQGEYVIIQDADLEYNPADYRMLLEAIKKGGCDMVLGARFRDGRKGLFMHRLGNRILTFALNFLFASHLNDYATCYKLARKTTFDELHLSAKGFDIDVQIVCNALKKHKKILEVPVSYFPRSYKEGKKIRWKDGLWALYYMLKYRFIP